MLEKKKAQEINLEYCNIRTNNKNIFLTITENNKAKKCPQNANLVFVKQNYFSKISKCIKRLKNENNINDIEVLPQKTRCEEKCMQKYCSLHFVINIQKYVPSCQPKTLQQKQFNLCQMNDVSTDSKNNSYSNLNVVVLIVVVFIVSTALSVLTCFYRRHKTTNRSETVS